MKTIALLGAAALVLSSQTFAADPITGAIDSVGRAGVAVVDTSGRVVGYTARGTAHVVKGAAYGTTRVVHGTVRTVTRPIVYHPRHNHVTKQVHYRRDWW